MTRKRQGRGRSHRGQKRSASKPPKRKGGNRGRRWGGRSMPTFDPSQFINKNPIDLKEEVYEPENTFSTFGLEEQLIDTISSMGIESPTPIQDQIIPEILNGRDVIGLAETGTGKTAAFLVPLINKTISDKDKMTLILAPTRELAIQIEEEFKLLSKGLNQHSTVCVGGMNINPQIRSLKQKNHFIIGTPGRVQDLIKRNLIKTGHITTVVLDEADRMLDMGFINDMRAILSKIRKDRETLLFSATMNQETDNIVHDFLNNPVEISVKKRDITNSIEQDIIHFSHDNKFQTLVDLLNNDEFKKVIIFGAMKHSVEKLSKDLVKNKIRSESIHGNKNHVQRQRALNVFKNGRAQVLVATDVAARGIHVDDVTHVINYDLPGTFEDYVHRIGRTGRSRSKGKALTFVQGKRN